MLSSIEMPISTPTVLVVEDDPAVRISVTAKLSEDGYLPLEADSVASARKQYGSPIDLALLDCRLPDGSGFELLRELKSQSPETSVIMMTGHGSISHAVEAMHAGAFHYLRKPIDLDELLILVAKALETSRLRDEVRALRLERARGSKARIVGQSPQMDRVRELLSRIATSPGSTVLVTGESGTGKDLVARAIHAESQRAESPFLNITCSALPSNLLESELFGHERGAFTDAKQRKIGLLEHANGGTVFLDEIGEMELGLQAKLLRFLEDRCFRRVGGTADIQADVRFVAATNVDPREAVRNHRFREDLYYRLAVLTLELPPLREREGDAILLAKHFLEVFRCEFSRRQCSLSDDALELIQSYPWPGNVRELKNAIERAVLLARSDVLTADDFTMIKRATVAPAPFVLPAAGVDMRALERDLVIQALQRTHGNRTRAARLLGMNRDQIRYRIEQFELTPDDYSNAKQDS